MHLNSWIHPHGSETVFAHILELVLAHVLIYILTLIDME
jgi:hypothetical protein